MDGENEEGGKEVVWEWKAQWMMDGVIGGHDEADDKRR